MMKIYLIGCVIAYIEDYFAFKWHHRDCWDGWSIIGPCKFGGKIGHNIALYLGGIVVALFSWVSVLCISFVWFMNWMDYRQWRD